jgi:hypothetical protein
MTAEAVVKLRVGDEVAHTAAEGGGPVHALDQALRKALLPSYPSLKEVRLADYKVRILDPDQATDATTRVVIEAACGEERWSTVGCSQNIIEASCQALMDTLELFLLRQQERDASAKVNGSAAVDAAQTRVAAGRTAVAAKRDVAAARTAVAAKREVAAGRTTAAAKREVAVGTVTNQEVVA